MCLLDYDTNLFDLADIKTVASGVFGKKYRTGSLELKSSYLSIYSSVVIEK